MESYHFIKTEFCPIFSFHWIFFHSGAYLDSFKLQTLVFFFILYIYRNMLWIKCSYTVSICTGFLFLMTGPIQYLTDGSVYCTYSGTQHFKNKNETVKWLWQNFVHVHLISLNMYEDISCLFHILADRFTFHTSVSRRITLRVWPSLLQCSRTRCKMKTKHISVLPPDTAWTVQIITNTDRVQPTK